MWIKLWSGATIQEEIEDLQASGEKVLGLTNSSGRGGCRGSGGNGGSDAAGGQRSRQSHCLQPQKLHDSVGNTNSNAHSGREVPQTWQTSELSKLADLLDLSESGLKVQWPQGVTERQAKLLVQQSHA